MSKTIVSPVKRWPGHVVLADPLTFPQLIAFREALAKIGQGNGNDWAVTNYTALSGVILCLEEVHLQGIPEGVTLETWPSTPPRSAARLIAWLLDEITKLMEEAEPDPNG